MAFKVTISREAQLSLELAPDPCERMQSLKDRISKVDEQHLQFLFQAAQAEMENYRRLTLDRPCKA